MSSIRPGARKPYSRPAGEMATGQWQHDRFPGATTRKAAPIAAERPGEGPGTRLEVSNLHYEVTPKDLTVIFGQIGTLVREPLVRYDGSGRSLGSAIVTFETNAEATRAKNQFDGILAKGQPMSIKIASRPPIAPRRIASAPPSTLSLLNRIEKPPLLARVARDDTDASRTPTGPRGAGGRGVGPIRSRGQHQPSARGGPKNKGGRGGRESKKPKTAEDLDKEIDAFMGDSEPTAGSEPSTGTPANGAQDVEMA